jgi:hypothetical protein
MSARDVVISNYGLLWLRKNVFWGKGKKRGHPKGVLAGNKTSDPVDFRDQIGLYGLYDETFRLVYVGQAGANDKQRFFQRLKQHRHDALANRWTRFSWYGIRWVTKKKRLSAGAKTSHPSIGITLNHIEAILITVAEPPHNRQGGRFGKDARQYLQFKDRDHLPPEAEEMILEMWKSHKQTLENR